MAVRQTAHCCVREAQEGGLSRFFHHRIHLSAVSLPPHVSCRPLIDPPHTLLFFLLAGCQRPSHPARSTQDQEQRHHFHHIQHITGHRCVLSLCLSLCHSLCLSLCICEAVCVFANLSFLLLLIAALSSLCVSFVSVCVLLHCPCVCVSCLSVLGDFCCVVCRLTNYESQQTDPHFAQSLNSFLSMCMPLAWWPSMFSPDWFPVLQTWRLSTEPT